MIIIPSVVDDVSFCAIIVDENVSVSGGAL